MSSQTYDTQSIQGWCGGVDLCFPVGSHPSLPGPTSFSQAGERGQLCASAPQVLLPSYSGASDLLREQGQQSRSHLDRRPAWGNLGVSAEVCVQKGFLFSKRLLNAFLKVQTPLGP